MSKTTISVATGTHSRFISNKGSYEHEQGRSIESDEFLNLLLELYEKATTIANTVLEKQAATNTRDTQKGEESQ